MDPLTVSPDASLNGKREGDRLLLALLSTTKQSLLGGIIARLCLTGFTYTQPFLINGVVSFVNEASINQAKNTGYFLIAATAIVYLGIAVRLLGSTYWCAY